MTPSPRRLSTPTFFLFGLVCFAACCILLLRSDPGRLVLEYLRIDSFSGIVYDDSTRHGVPGALVHVRTWGFDPLHGGGWQAQRAQTDTTDAQGRFRVRYRRLPGGTKGYVVSQSHSPLFFESIDVRTLAIPVARLDEDADDVAAFIVNPTFHNQERVAYLNLSELRLTTGDSADVAMRVDIDIQPRLLLSSFGLGGVIRRDLANSPPLDAAALECRAPHTGYSQADTLLLPASRTLYYVRSRGGKHFGRLVVQPDQLARAAEELWQAGPAVPVWVNLSGGTGLCGPDPILDGFLGNTGASVRALLHGVPDRRHPRAADLP